MTMHTRFTLFMLSAVTISVSGWAMLAPEPRELLAMEECDPENPDPRFCNCEGCKVILRNDSGYSFGVKAVKNDPGFGLTGFCLFSSSDCETVDDECLPEEENPEFSGTWLANWGDDYHRRPGCTLLNGLEAGGFPSTPIACDDTWAIENNGFYTTHICPGEGGLWLGDINWSAKATECEWTVPN